MLLLLNITGFIRAGNLEQDYTPIRSKGIIPEDITIKSSDRFKKQISKIDKKKERKLKEEFLLKSSFGLKSILQNSNTIFNHSITNYINEVADIILKNDPELRKKLRFYAYKSPLINAYALDEGVILINLGLISKLKNEAQLAFILCHEISHYINKDGIDLFLETKKIDGNKKKYTDISYEEKILQTAYHSRKNESRADEDGLALFLKTSYDVKSIAGIFDILKYVKVPFENKKVDPSFFNHGNYVFPKENFQGKLHLIKPKNEKTDVYGSHPGTKERAKNIAKKIIAQEKGKVYIVSESKFKQIREIARFELSYQYLIKGFYASAIYNSYLLQKKYPNNIFLKKTISKALAQFLLSHPLTSKRNQKDTLTQEKKEINPYDKIEGNGSIIEKILHQTPTNELIILSIVNVLKTKSEIPFDENLNKLFHHLTYLFAAQELDINDYMLSPEQLKKDTVNANQEYFYNPLYLRTALYDFASDTSIINIFEKNKQAYNRYIKDHKVENSKSKRRQKKTQEIKKREEFKTNRILVLNPSYYRIISGRKETSYKYLISEGKEENFIQKLKENAQLNKVKVSFLEYRTIQSDQIDKFNDIAILNDWIKEQIRNAQNDIKFSSIDKIEIDRIIKKYNTKYVVLTSMVSVKDKKAGRFFPIAISVVAPPLAIFAIPNLISSINYTNYAGIVFNLEKNRIELVHFRDIGHKTNNTIMDSSIYDVFLQINSKTKHRK